MDVATKTATSDFVKSVARFGSQISSVLHNFASLEGSVGHTLSSLIGNLDASIHSLNQICGLLVPKVEPARFLNDEGLKYVELLAEESAIAIEKIKWIITSDNRYEANNSPKYWKSPISTNEKGQKALVVTNLDEVALFRDMKNAKGRVMFNVLADPAERLDYLQLLLLLVVQVMTVQDMTKKLPSGTVDLASIVDYHTRIVRAAQKLSIGSGDGLARHAKSNLPQYSPYISSDSDSDFSIRREPLPPLRRPCPPPPPPPGWKPVVLPPVSLPPKELVTILPGPPCPPESLMPSVFSQSLSDSFSTPRVVDLDGDNYKPAQNVNPPLYSEKDGVVESATAVSELPASVSASSSDKLMQTVEQPPDHKQGEKQLEPKQNDKSTSPKPEDKSTKISSVDEGPRPTANDSARLLNSHSSGLGMKLKSLFRSKSSLEAEMKRTLSDADASLKAFIVQHRELRKVPHSAFHSLEYTHMRTILWQLKDNTWFKTFSDLTDAEHDAMEKMLQKFWHDGKWFQRELVVLKVMQENKYNAWMRVMEDCMGLEWSKPHHENYRIILAIVREKQCEPETISPGPRLPSKPRPNVVDCYDPPQVPRVPDPLPTMQGDNMLVDLDKSRPLAIVDELAPLPRPPPLSFPPPAVNVPPPPGWMRQPPTRLPNQNNAGPLSPSGEIQLGHSEVVPRNAVSEESARDALISYEAFTFRPALQQQSSLAPHLNLPPRKWSRCFITREREETTVLLQRIEMFRSRGISIIDLKIQLTEPQAAQVTNLVQELNQLEKDKRFEHKLVELSMIDREHGIVTKQVAHTNIDVIHVITQRALKQGVPPLMTYNALMNRNSPAMVPTPAFIGPPPPPPPKNDPEIIVINDSPRRWSPPRRAMGRGRRRSIASYSSSDSDSSTITFTTSSSIGYRRKGRNGRKYGGDSDSDSGTDEEVKARWKTDPVTIKFTRKEKGKDVVQLLLEKWTPAGDGKLKEKDETKERKDAQKKKKRSRRRAVSDSDSLIDD